MFDMKAIRENPDRFDLGLTRRGMQPLSEKVLEMDRQYRALQTQLQELQSKRNAMSAQIGAVKKAGGDVEAIMVEVGAIKDQMIAAEELAREKGEEIFNFLAILPNTPDESVPTGSDETGNVVVRTHGIKPTFDFTPLEHDVLGEKSGLLDTEMAARISGARFTILKAGLARLERAIGQFMIDMHTGEHGYTELSVPLLVKDKAAFGTANLPKFKDDLFQTTNGYWLIPTAEVSLTNTVAETILDEKDLPIRITALTPCFRSEAGSAGRDIKGMFRQHQFYKTELVSITRPEDSFAELERMVNCAENVLKKLGLHYQVVQLCSGDMGFASTKTYDIEVWLPGQNRYREISSCSNCVDFQARRMDARYRKNGEKGTIHVHTLNGSGVAVGRTLIAVMENYQQADGSIKVPEALRPYMGGMDVIR
ncbi:MAG: serine--tRNA ligase [Lactobacillales bacterium]|jgi:seryl-tRNA synthetase|nr:serine--tRNA ligase [Lactobacillales bacterium]